MKDTFKHKGLRQKLVAVLKAKGITNNDVLDAIGKIPRHLFMDSSFLDHAYQDKAFPIAADQTISQPYTVAFQTELMQVKRGDKVLEIGTGSGYQTAVLCELGAKVLLYEAGEALRYDEFSIRAGVKGIINVMRQIGMLNKVKRKGHPIAPFIARQSGWVRANESGLINHHAQLGDHVSKGEVLGTIANPYGDVLDKILSPSEGVVIGKQNIPLAQEGEAMYHIAYFRKPDSVAEHMELLQDNLVMDEPSIVY